MYIRLLVKYQILIKFAFSRQFFLNKSSNIRLHQNTSIGSRNVSCGQTDMTKLTVAFRNFANAPNKQFLLPPVRVKSSVADIYYPRNLHSLTNRMKKYEH